MNLVPPIAEDGAAVREALDAIGPEAAVDLVLQHADRAAAERIALATVAAIEREDASGATLMLGLAVTIASQVESIERRLMTAETINGLVARLTTMDRLDS